MSLIDRFRHTNDPLPHPARNGHPANTTTARTPLHMGSGSKAAVQTPAAGGRFSNGLKEFLWQLEDLGRGNLLDLGQVSQNTLNFFIARNFKVYTEDILVAWREFAREEEESSKKPTAGAQTLDNAPGARAERFLNANFNHAPESFDAVLLWDVLDYLDRDMVNRLMQRLSTLVRDGGAIFSIFHTRTPEVFYRYRVLDGLNLDPFQVNAILPAQRIYQNREIQDLFSRFRTSKTFVARDQLREIVFAK